MDKQRETMEREWQRLPGLSEGGRLLKSPESAAGFEAGFRAGLVASPPEEEMPADLRRLLEDPGIVIRQDAAVFDLIGKWQKAKATTESGESRG